MGLTQQRKFWPSGLICWRRGIARTLTPASRLTASPAWEGSLITNSRPSILRRRSQPTPQSYPQLLCVVLPGTRCVGMLPDVAIFGWERMRPCECGVIWCIYSALFAALFTEHPSWWPWPSSNSACPVRMRWSSFASTCCARDDFLSRNMKGLFLESLFLDGRADPIGLIDWLINLNIIEEWLSQYPLIDCLIDWLTDFVLIDAIFSCVFLNLNLILSSSKRRGAINAKQLDYLNGYRPKSRLKQGKNGQSKDCCIQWLTGWLQLSCSGYYWSLMVATLQKIVSCCSSMHGDTDFSSITLPSVNRPCPAPTPSPTSPILPSPHLSSSVHLLDQPRRPDDGSDSSRHHGHVKSVFFFWIVICTSRWRWRSSHTHI